MSNGKQTDMDALRENIEHTRQRISGEIEAIGERLTPAHAKEVARNKMVETKDRMVGNARERVIVAKDRAVSNARQVAHRASDLGTEFPNVVRENPIPTAMLLVGTGWLAYRTYKRLSGPRIEIEVVEEPIVETEEVIGIGEERLGASPLLETGGMYAEPPTGSMESRSSLGERARALKGNARERVGSAAHAAKSRLSGTAGAVKQRAGVVRERAGHLATRGREGATEVWGRSQHVYESNPLALGAVCFFAGIGLGMLLPHTEREDRMLGERRQHVVGRAKHFAEEAKEVAIHSAKEGMKTARETAKHDASERELISR